MVATVVVKEMNGSPINYTTVSVGSPARYKTKDEVTSDLNYPCVIPADGLAYSYWKSHCLDLSDTFTRINNVRFYTDGATSAWTYGTGGLVQIGQLDATPLVTAQGLTTAEYDDASGTEGTTGDDLYAAGGHLYYKTGVGAAPVDVADFTSIAPMIVDLGNHDAAEKTKHVVTQVVIDDDATRGLQADATYTFVWTWL
jgi:hypothetical protein